MNLRYPDFFIVGAGKAGTTALWRYLSSHNEIYMTKDIRFKELGYFSDNYGVSDEKKYLEFFSEAKPNQRIGESCHTYLTAPESPKRIFTKLPNARIIIMLRDPVKRAYSLYNWMVMNGHEKLGTFKEALEAEPHRIHDQKFIQWATPYYFRNFFYLNSGLYFNQVKPYIDLFGSNCRVYLFEEFNRSSENVLMDICDFLDINFDSEIRLKRENESKIPFSIKRQFYFQNDLRWKLRKLGFSVSFSNRIINFLMNLNTSSKKPEKLDKATYATCRNFFEKDIADLGKLIGKDLNQIWKY
jgi:hypothetical protein